MRQQTHAEQPTRAHHADARRAAAIVAAALIAACTPDLLAADPFPAEIDLAQIDPLGGGDGSVGFVLQALTPSDLKGRSIAGAGDIDGDGMADILMGGPGLSPCNRCGAYLVFGRNDFDADFDVVQDAIQSNGAEGFVIRGIDANENTGQSVSAVGDLNGDGLADFVIGAPFADPDGLTAAGDVYVVFGRASGFHAFFDVTDLLASHGGDGSEGFVVSGFLSNDNTGWSAGGGCDVNADGIDDLLIGAPDTVTTGRAHVIFGRTTGFPPEFGLARLLPPNGGDGSEGVTFQGITGGDETGWSVSCLGDTNGDGIDDILIGAPFADPNFVSSAGNSYLVFGHAPPFPATFALSTLLPANGGNGSTGSVLEGANSGDESAYSVASAGDVNADGLDDIVIGAPDADPSGRSTAGRVFVVFGRANGFPPEFGLARLLPPNGGDGTEGFVLNGDGSGDVLGTSVAGAGDVNDDGFEDVIAGAPTADPPTRSNAGDSYIYYGRASFAATFEVSSLLAIHGGDGSQGFVLIGSEGDDRAGTAVSAAGDVNGDGAADVLVGAPKASLSGFTDAGKGYLVYGRPADTDGDGVPQSQDNCTLVANADQRDTDGDGIGNICDADLDNNCAVNFGDLGKLKQVFFSGDPNADFNGDGSVNFIDLGIMQQGFFQPPGPSGVPNVCSSLRAEAT